ncbi:unnamed protein product [Rhizoctonia solani]|uniref:Ricin B lectin domain-containing protein n=2 Tax=Rhizoctonia solani TaxID=456999 RepID=A0A8H3CK14_9AGAM|nr:hypothetical protein V565_255880 [Rhizoctonia solani 123E]CAE6484252.1 unnamed protein product [Rhizoctonia solani]
MVQIHDGEVYRIDCVANNMIASYGRSEFVPGAIITVRPYDLLEGEYESRFVAKSVSGDKWKFVLLNNPSVCLGFHGSPFDGDVPLSTVRDEGNAHTEWVVDHGNGDKESLIHMPIDSGDVAWTIPVGCPPGTPIELKGQNGSPGQQWKIGIPEDE